MQVFLFKADLTVLRTQAYCDSGAHKCPSKTAEMGKSPTLDSVHLSPPVCRQRGSQGQGEGIMGSWTGLLFGRSILFGPVLRNATTWHIRSNVKFLLIAFMISSVSYHFRYIVTGVTACCLQEGAKGAAHQYFFLILHSWLTSCETWVKYDKEKDAPVSNLNTISSQTSTHLFVFKEQGLLPLVPFHISKANGNHRRDVITWHVNAPED